MENEEKIKNNPENQHLLFQTNKETSNYVKVKI